MGRGAILLTVVASATPHRILAAGWYKPLSP